MTQTRKLISLSLKEVYRQPTSSKVTLKPLTSFFHLDYKIAALSLTITLALQSTEGERKRGTYDFFLLRRDLEAAHITSTHIHWPNLVTSPYLAARKVGEFVFMIGSHSSYHSSNFITKGRREK